MFLWSPVTPLYLYPNKERINPNQTPSFKNPVVSLLKSVPALPNVAFTINNSSKVIWFHLQGGKYKNNKITPHNFPNSIMNTHQLWLLKQWYLLPK